MKRHRSVSLRGERLVLDAGELSSELRPLPTDGASPTTYLLHDPPLSLLSQGKVGTVHFEVGSGSESQMVLAIAANPTGPERDFVFEPLTSAGTPSS
jgi:hypothetical protein